MAERRRQRGRALLDAARSLSDLLAPVEDPDGLDNYDQRIASLVVSLCGVVQRYFRASVVGLDNMPAGKALVVGNHNAGITFLEPFVFGREWYLRNDGEDGFLFVAHDAMVALPVVGSLLSRLGAVRGNRETAGRILAAGRKLVTFPGGNREAFRPWTERHRVDFHGHKGFARLAIRHGAPIVPLLSVGGHNTFFVLSQGRALARWTGADKLLRSPSFPVFIGLPWGLGIGPVFHFPLPAKMHIEVGEPIPTAHIPPEVADDPETLQALYAEVEGRLQAMMDRHRARRARRQ